MRNESLKQMILNYLRNSLHSGAWINGGQIEQYAESLGFKASNASRRCRELYNEVLIERKIDKTPNGKIASVWYKDTAPLRRTEYRTPDGNLIYTKREYA